MRHCPKDIKDVPAALVGLVPPASAADIKEHLYKGEGVKDRLRHDQHDKCIFCECRINGDYGAIEHFRPKKGYSLYPDNTLITPGYYWLAYDWSNLLMSCSQCNSSYKKNHFLLADESGRHIDKQKITDEEPLLINPSLENPARYIEFHEHIAAAKTDANGDNPKGRHTIDLLQLNGRPDLVRNRRRVWNNYQTEKNKLRIMEEMLDRGYVFDEIKQLVELCRRTIAEMESPDGEYSAMFLP